MCWSLLLRGLVGCGRKAANTDSQKARTVTLNRAQEARTVQRVTAAWCVINKKSLVARRQAAEYSLLCVYRAGIAILDRSVGY